MKKIKVYIVAILMCVIFSLVGYWYFFLRGPLEGISAYPPEIYRKRPVHLIDNANYLQGDPQWAGTPLGRTGVSIKKIGCTMSSVAMALKNMGYDYTPKTLNTRVTLINGYTSSGWFKWKSVELVSDGQAVAHYYDEPDHAVIDSCLRQGQYPIIKFKLYNMFSHWVIITARTPKEYLVRDPLVVSLNPIPLSSRAGRILSVRCVAERWPYRP